MENGGSWDNGAATNENREGDGEWSSDNESSKVSFRRDFSSGLKLGIVFVASHKLTADKRHVYRAFVPGPEGGSLSALQRA